MKSAPVALITVNVHGVGPEAAEHPEEDLFGKLAHGRYTYRVGLARLLDKLRDLDLRATFFWPVFEAERCPALLEACLADGHEVASHGHAFEDHAGLGAREADLLAAAHETLTRLTGVAPIGFRSPTGSLSDATIGLLAGLGYRYDSSFVDDDAPYSLAADGGPGMVELPWSEGLSDATHFRRRLTQGRAEAFFLEEFEALIGVDGYACLTLHPRADIGVGRAARLVMLERLLGQFREKHGVVFSRCCDLVAKLSANGSAGQDGGR
jgi:peptidoglycan/xylan/chitin deacetylase (PgdA/CDA1 family)